MSSTLIGMEMTLHGTGTMRIMTISDDEEEAELIHESTFEINDLKIDLGSLRVNPTIPA